MCPYPAFCENETLIDNWNLIIQLQEETLRTKFKKPTAPKRFMQNWERNQLNTLIKNSKNDIETAIAITNYMIAKPTSNVPTWNNKKQNYENQDSNNNSQYFGNTSSQLEKNNWSAGI